MLDVHGLTKRFGGVLANDGVSFSVNAGELVGIIGPNGAGKSTLFELITGFVRPDAGGVRLDGRPLAGLSTWQINRAGIARDPVAAGRPRGARPSVVAGGRRGGGAAAGGHGRCSIGACGKMAR